MPELRKDPIIGRWVIISTERGKRPHDFVVEPEVTKGGFCPFDEGNEHTTPPEVLAYRDPGTEPNSPGWQLRVVNNKFPALATEGELDRAGEGMFDKMNGVGSHEVIIESPDHHLTLATIPVEGFYRVLKAYRDRIVALSEDPRFRYVLIFKNQGRAAGASLEHSHCQLIALPIVPLNVAEELHGAHQYYRYKERCVYCDLILQELDDGRRLVAENDDFVTVCPFAPRFPMEAWILPKRHSPRFEEGTKHEYRNLARAMQDVLRRLGHVLTAPPYNYVIHSSPVNEADYTYYHWHIEIMPKLTQVAGFEWGTGFYINPVPPEDAAAQLRSAPL